MHGSKGLEADYIVIPGMTTGTYGFPSTIADDPVLDLAMPAPETFPHAEERRLFYVALTRARRAVLLITHPRRMSPFVIELLKDPHVTVTGNSDAPAEICPGAVKGRWSNETASSARFSAARPSRRVSTHARCSSGRRAPVRPPEDGTEARVQMYPLGNSRRTIRLDLVRSMRSPVLEIGVASAAELDDFRLATTRLWCEAAALRRTAGARVLQYWLALSSLTRSTGPAARTWRCAGTSQCSTAAARGLAASSPPLSLSQSVKKTSPRRRPRSTIRRAEGTASLVAVAMVMASGIGAPAARAASSHAAS